jgi:hypothetical protein
MVIWPIDLSVVVLASVLKEKVNYPAANATKAELIRQ